MRKNIELYGFLAFEDALKVCLKCPKPSLENRIRFANFGGFASKKHGVNLGKNSVFSLIYCFLSRRFYWCFSFGIHATIHSLMRIRRMAL